MLILILSKQIHILAYCRHMGAIENAVNIKF